LSTAGCLGSTGITPLQRYCTPIRHPLAFDPLPGFAGYRIYLAPGISPRDEEGFSSCSACPCQRAVAITPPEWSAASASLRCTMLPSPSRLRVRPPGLRTFGATCAFTCVTAR
jgi:hypothetical protein